MVVVWLGCYCSITVTLLAVTQSPDALCLMAYLSSKISKWARHFLDFVSLITAAPSRRSGTRPQAHKVESFPPLHNEWTA